jgi:putative DNA primase/helicase
LVEVAELSECADVVRDRIGNRFGLSSLHLVPPHSCHPVSLRVVQLEESFLGREDRSLDAKLRTELTGILNWSLEGLDRIIRQPFTVPTASDEAIRDLQDLVSPISAFVRDFCDRGRDKTVKAQDLYAAWRQYCEDNGHRATASSVFGRDLRSVMPTLRHYQPHGQPRQYVGLELKPTAARYSNAYTTHSGANHVSPVSPVSNGAL